MWNSGTTTLTDCTVSGNSAAADGGLHVGNGGTMTLGNTLVAGNTASDLGPWPAGVFVSSGNNLIGNTDGSTPPGSSSDLTGTIADAAPPRARGPGQLRWPDPDDAPAPRQPRHRRGQQRPHPGGVTTDQRGASRIVNGTVDIGAVESQGYTLTVTGGNSQTTNATTAFASPLAVSVTPINASEPVNGGVVTFAAPGSGASLTPSTTSATIAGGSASVTATANNTVGTFNVSAIGQRGRCPGRVQPDERQPTGGE